MSEGNRWVSSTDRAVTLFVAVLITETLLLPLYATYAFVPAAVTPHGHVLTGTVAVTLFATVSITETVSL